MTPDEIKSLAEVFQQVPGIKGIDLKDVRRLAELLRQSPEIGSIELRGWFGTGVVITRTQHGVATPMAFAPLPAAPTVAGAVGAVAGAAGSDLAEGPKAPASQLKEVKSPMVGTFYAAPEPGAEPYVKVGSRVAPGQTVCIIEAMKIMNEIQAETKGTIVEVLVENGQPVEYGQRLFKVKQG